MFGVHSNSIEPKVQHVLCHCYAAINIFIKIFKVLITFSHNMNYSLLYEENVSSILLLGVPV